jgi:hypothetical protein
MQLLGTLLMLGCLLVGGALLLGSFSELRHALLLWRARRVRAGDLGHGDASVVDVRGQVHLEEPLCAPLSGKSCAQWHLVVSRAPARPGQPRDGLADLLVFQEARPFWVDDGSGRVRVSAPGRAVPLSELKPTREALTRLNQRLEALLSARLGMPAAAWCHQREVTAVETALFAYDEVSLVARRALHPRLAVDPVHITLGRPRVVALRTAMRSVVAAGFAVVFFAVAQWLR